MRIVGRWDDGQWEFEVKKVTITETEDGRFIVEFGSGYCIFQEFKVVGQSKENEEV